MTTLPQTTGARFPRAGARAPSIPALAQVGGGGLAHGQAGATGMTFGDVMRVLRANVLLIILCLISALILGFVVNNWVFMPYMRQYTARAVLQVQSPSKVNPYEPTMGTNDFADRQMLEVRQKTLAQKLLSQDLWRPLLSKPDSDVRKSEWIKSFEDKDKNLDTAKALEEVQDHLGVTPNPMTELITVTLAAPTAKDAKTLLNGIVRQLVDTEQSDVRDSTNDERTALTQLQTRLNTLVGNLNVKIDDLAGRLNMPRDRSGNNNGLQMVLQMELQQLVAERIRKEGDYAEAGGAFQAFASALDAGQSPGKLEQELEMNMGLQRMQDRLDQAETYLASSRAQYAPDHRLVRDAEAQFNAIKAQVEAKRNDLRISLGAQLRDMLQRMAQTAEADLKQTMAQIEEGERRLGELNKETSNYNTALELREYYNEKKNKVEERLTVLEASNSRELQKRGTVRLWGPIEEPDKMSFPDLKLTLGVAGLLGLGLSLGIAFLREMMDTTVRSPRDITKVGNLNLLGMIPHTDDDPQAAAGELSLAISQSPNSIIAENFRQVRTRMQHAASLDTTRSLLVTSPGPGDGKTVVACNLAAGLALNGRKILLVDANFRRPALHSVFGVANDSGFGSVLSGAAQVEQVAHKTQVPNLDVLTTGPRPANPTELLESQLLTDFIDHALEEYDHVIFDAGPILLVSETVALAPRVDGVVTVVRAKANSRGLLQRMRDALRQLKAEHLGVVLNGVRQHTGGYYRRNIKNYYAYQNGND